ncbi:hypothetical protein ABT097_27995 [Streptomyces sp. NPDC002225]|uniref:hypothetical protein n=1 Tax=Streptomyces sp. NPDC002225 TaxID=3154413 RepID=UPI003316AE7F
MNPPPPDVTVLRNSFYAFYDLHRPAYLAYATARLSQEEARIAVACLFELVGGHWTAIVSRQRPSAWAWEQHTRTVDTRNGHALTPAENTALLHHELLLSVDQIATMTGAEPASVTALLAAADRTAQHGAHRARTPRTARPTRAALLRPNRRAEARA